LNLLVRLQEKEREIKDRAYFIDFKIYANNANRFVAARSG